MKNRYNFLLLFLMISFVFSCTKNKGIEIKGTIEGGEGKKVILESYDSRIKSDTLVLDKNGNFNIRVIPLEYPEFMTLTIENNTITLALDSTDNVSIVGNIKDFQNNYTLTGSAESQKIKEIAAEGIKLKKQFNDYDAMYLTHKIDATQFADSVKYAMLYYKEIVTPYIFENPASPAAYFTIFQKVNGLMVFDPNDKNDYLAFAAVATAWNNFHKDHSNTRPLKDITLGALYKKRIGEKTKEQLANIQEQNMIEIVLPNKNGKQISLSDMNGNVVLLNFTMYGADFSPAYNMKLAKIYDKFKKKGFEIYQVSLDTDDNFWKNTASNLPWITVNDKESVYSRAARNYNVTTLPTSYLLDKDGSVVYKITDLNEAESKISEML